MIYLGGDHNGFALKERLKQHFDKKGIKYEDLGPLEFAKTDDYPDFGLKVAKKIAEDSENNRGILICGSSVGVCIVANKFLGIRAGGTDNAKLAEIVRKHDNINVLCLAGWELNFRKAKKIVEAFLNTPFSGEERHVRRIAKIKKIEEQF